MTWESSENPLILGACHCPLFTVGPTAAWPLSAPVIAPECETSGLKKGNPSYRALVKMESKRLMNEILYYLIQAGHMVWLIHHSTNGHQWVLSYGAEQRACSHGPLGEERRADWLKKGNPSYRALVKIVAGKRLKNKVQYYLIPTRHMVWRYTPCYQ